MIELITGVQSARLSGVNINDAPPPSVTFMTIKVDTALLDYPEELRDDLDGAYVVYDTDLVRAAIDDPGLHEFEISTHYNELSFRSSALVEVLDWVGGEKYNLSNNDNLVKVPDYLPSSVTDMARMFNACESFNQDLSNWDTSNVTTMAWMFGNTKVFNGDISQWDVSNVIDMYGMFYRAIAFNRDIPHWVLSSNPDLDRMFQYATAFNGDISGWDVSNVSNMARMFQGATVFNRDLSQWDVSNVTSTWMMFNEARAFNQPLGDWSVSNVTSMSEMFWNATSYNQDLSGWCVSQFETVPFRFSTGARNWTQPKPIWGTCP